LLPLLLLLLLLQQVRQPVLQAAAASSQLRGAPGLTQQASYVQVLTIHCLCCCCCCCRCGNPSCQRLLTRAKYEEHLGSHNKRPSKHIMLQPVELSLKVRGTETQLVNTLKQLGFEQLSQPCAIRMPASLQLVCICTGLAGGWQLRCTSCPLLKQSFWLAR
jgi:hypothetical protein